jgi:hypothetical protein
MKPVFKSKEYGIGGHNKLEVRVMEDGVQLWLQDGECNAIVYLDREDFAAFAKVVNKVKDQAPETIEPYDFSTPVHKRKKIVTTSEANETNGVSKRKPRSDKGKKREAKRKVVAESYEEMKARKIQEAMK